MGVPSKPKGQPKIRNAVHESLRLGVIPPEMLTRSRSGLLAKRKAGRRIAAGTIDAPPLVTVGTVKVRLWTERDVEKARKVLAGAKPVQEEGE